MRVLDQSLYISFVNNITFNAGIKDSHTKGFLFINSYELLDRTYLKILRSVLETMIEKIDHVVLFVTDMEEATKFYTEILGFNLNYPSPEYTSIELPGTCSIGLHIADKVNGIESGGATTQVSFAVSDIEESYNILKDRGVNITREIE